MTEPVAWMIREQRGSRTRVTIVDAWRRKETAVAAAARMTTPWRTCTAIPVYDAPPPAPDQSAMRCTGNPDNCARCDGSACYEGATALDQSAMREALEALLTEVCGGVDYWWGKLHEAVERAEAALAQTAAPKPTDGLKMLVDSDWLRKRVETDPDLGEEVVPKPTDALVECHGLDTPSRVCFYEQDFYVLSNFSAFSIMWPVSSREGDARFDTSEAVYHFEKFICRGRVPTSTQRAIAQEIKAAPSAHEAFKIAEANKLLRRADWDAVKVDVMRDILRAKADQHEYVRRKLLDTGDRELVENSWRDDFWGWGPNRDGQNMLGKLWMEVRAELRGAQ